MILETIWNNIQGKIHWKSLGSPNLPILVLKLSGAINVDVSPFEGKDQAKKKGNIFNCFLFAFFCIGEGVLDLFTFTTLS